MYIPLCWTLVWIFAGTEYVGCVPQRSLEENPEDTDRWTRKKSAKLCGLPIVLPKYEIAPQNMRGIWYGFAQRAPESIQVNQMANFTVVGQTVAPLTAIPAEMHVTNIFWYDDMKGDKCHSQYMVGYTVSDGRIMTLNYDSGKPVPYPNYYFFLHLEDTFWMLYKCGLPNFHTSICENPKIYVCTRKRPDEMEEDEIDHVENTINAVLEPHCLSMANMTRKVWTTQLPICHAPSPDCFESLVQGYMSVLFT